MTNYSTVTEAVRAAVESAAIDPDAPREPRDLRVRYNVDCLERVVRLTRTPDGLNAVDSAVHEELTRQLMEKSDVHRALAAMRLGEKVNLPSRDYREGPGGIEPV